MHKYTQRQKVRLAKADEERQERR